jgi:phosphohistidine phosphatase
MKNLLILRHANADHGSHSGRDIERELSLKGRTQCHALCAQIEVTPYHPQSILCSPAQRTRQTLELISSAFGKVIPTSYERDFYYGGTEAFFEAIIALPPEITTAMIVGHNPTLSYAASQLLRTPISLQTSTLCIIQLDTETWGNAQTCPASLSIQLRG